MKKTLLKTVLISICAFIIGMSFMGGSGGGDSSSASASSSALDISDIENSNFIVKTDEEGALPVLSKEQLKSACNCLSGEQKTNALKFIDALKEAEDKYKLNAIFSLSVFRAENGIATDKSGILGEGTYNIGSVSGRYKGQYITVKRKDGSTQDFKKYPNYDEAIIDYADNIVNGAYYFKKGLYSIDKIAPVYCNEAWGNTVKGYILEFYKSAGLEVADSSSSSSSASSDIGNGNKDNKQQIDKNQIGYTSTYTVGGKKFKEWKQYPLNGTQGEGWSNWLKNSGCGLTSAAIILGGVDDKITPYYLYSYKNGREKVGSVNIPTYIRDAKVSYKVAKNLEDVKKGLLNGKKVILCLVKDAKINGESWAGSSGHYITLLDISKDGKKVYVSNPGANPTHKNGFVKLDLFSGKVFFEHTYIIDV